MLRFRYRMRPRKMQIYPEGGPEARMKKLRQIVSGLIRYERLETNWNQADEARQYAERLLYLAIKNGDKHRHTMDVADYWLLEKDLIHKLFKVLAPRFQDSKTSYTSLHKLATEYPGQGKEMAVLELKGNPWPPVKPPKRETKFLLSNVLLAAARQEFFDSRNTVAKQQDPSSTSASSSPPLTSSSFSPSSGPEENVENDLSSSVDPSPDSQTSDKIER